MKSSSSRNIPVALALGVGITIAANVGAQGLAQPTVVARLAAVTRLECRFAAVATGTWGEDDSVASLSAAPAELEASFTNVDIQAGTAEAVSRFGSSFIVVRYAEGYLHLIQQIDIGPLYITTIIAEQTAAGRFIAVHTRHEFAASRYAEFRERPKMYIGDCAAEGA